MAVDSSHRRRNDAHLIDHRDRGIRQDACCMMKQPRIQRRRGKWRRRRHSALSGVSLALPAATVPLAAARCRRYKPEYSMPLWWPETRRRATALASADPAAHECRQDSRKRARGPTSRHPRPPNKRAVAKRRPRASCPRRVRGAARWTEGALRQPLRWRPAPRTPRARVPRERAQQPRPQQSATMPSHRRPQGMTACCILGLQLCWSRAQHGPERETA
jgi:hypothetical protein